MAFHRRSGSSFAAASHFRRRSGSTWAVPEKIDRRVGAAWVRVWNNYTAIHSVYVSPTTASNTAGSGAGTRYTDSATAHASGGTGSYSYQWALHEGDSSITASSPNSQTTQFQAYFGNVTASKNATFRVTISDGVSSAVAYVSVYLYNNRTGSGGGQVEY